MARENDIEFVETMIGDCGSANEMAELAYHIKAIATYHSDDQMMDWYQILRNKIIYMAGIPAPYDDDFLVDEAISRIGKASS